MSENFGLQVAEARALLDGCSVEGVSGDRVGFDVKTVVDPGLLLLWLNGWGGLLSVFFSPVAAQILYCALCSE
ncbi:hypothetical protein GV64_13005 [Endozoicomonas elysicola]|uniref:Uncharacterized protein n=1 Tax=Endozoicomonas elysicola TaxID=305900 RepID=A0A081KBK9_9GAMM|nr:hypothetical protein GV64_13005 [Endozoicomonas elysicola]